MRKLIFLTFLILNLPKANAQMDWRVKINSSFSGSQKYITFNPFAVAEPQMAIAVGFGNRFTERSEYFSEISYVAKSPFYKIDITNLNGFRIITQYRYHFLQKWKPLINLGKKKRERNARLNPFIGVECRLKHYAFSDDISSGLLIKNSITGDVINNFAYDAKALILGAAIVWGGSYNIDDKWKIEITGGLGGRNKRVLFKNIPSQYEVFNAPRLGGFGIPAIYKNSEGGSVVYAVRIKYFFEKK